MNRRSFIKGISLAIAGVTTSPSLFLPKLIERPVWRRNRWVLNPGYDTAHYQIRWIIKNVYMFNTDSTMEVILFNRETPNTPKTTVLT
jgi:hypothetical protein